MQGVRGWILIGRIILRKGCNDEWTRKKNETKNSVGIGRSCKPSDYTILANRRDIIFFFLKRKIFSSLIQSHLNFSDKRKN